MGNNYILTIYDDLIKYLLGVPLVNYQTNTVTEVFTVNFVWIYETPGTVFTD